MTALLFSASLVTVAMGACGRNDDLGTDTSSGGASSSAGSGGTGGGASSTAASSSSASGSGGGGGIDAGPTGPTRLTIVNGLVDYPAARLCFLPDDTPWPAAATGLAYGAASVVDPIAPTVPAGSDVTVWLVTGDLTQAAGKTCTQILALPPPSGDAGAPDAGSAGVLSLQLAVIPQAVLSAQKSLLLVVTGCAGGPGHDDSSGGLACGMGYSPTSPTAGVLLGAMSRITDPGHVSLQVAAGSAGTPLGDVRVTPGLTTPTDAVIAPLISFGAIAPAPPFQGLSLNEFGDVGTAALKTFPQNSGTATSQIALGDVFAASAVKQADFLDGGGFVLVARGAHPALGGSTLFQKYGYTLVKADPGAD